eukprot:8246395-Karenia_brevis.AAC.1
MITTTKIRMLIIVFVTLLHCLHMVMESCKCPIDYSFKDEFIFHMKDNNVQGDPGPFVDRNQEE